MREYDANLVQKLLADRTRIEIDSLPLETKLVPDEARSGYPDPRFLKPLLDRPAQMESIVFSDLTIDQMRQFMGSPNRNLNTVEIITGYEVLNAQGNSVGVWRYYPRKPFDHCSRPALVFIHGGGFIGGTPFAVENFCRLVAELADAVVFNVDYSLAPEKPFPNGLNDCYAVINHVRDHATEYGVDPGKITVGGDSAGGNLSAACCLKDHADQKNTIKAQYLLYPALLLGTAKIAGFSWRLADFNLCDEYRPMLEPMVLGFAPKEDEVPGFEAFYVQDGEDFNNPLVSPLKAPDFTIFPQTLIATAEYDGLRVQGELFGRLLQKAGADVRTIRYNGIGHAFIDVIGLLPQAEALACEIAASLKAL